MSARSGVRSTGRPKAIPPPSTARWTPPRKAAVVAAVDEGVLTVDEACERYRLSLEELVGWQRAVERAGPAGLRLTYAQHYRRQWRSANNEN